MEYLEQHPALLSLLICCARILDVSIGTVRTILVFRGYRVLAMFAGFLEVLIWVQAAGIVVTHIDRWYFVISYAAGFSIGNYVGISLESRLAVGSELVRVISRNRDVDLAQVLRADGYRITEIDGRDDDDVPVEVLLVTERRRRVPQLLRTIERLDANAIWTISDVKRMPAPRRARRMSPLDWRGMLKRR